MIIKLVILGKINSTSYTGRGVIFGVVLLGHGLPLDWL